MRYVTSGESHGRALTTIVSDVPAGIPFSQNQVDVDLARRQGGYGRGGRMRIERDKGLILSGVRYGKTLGSPVAITVANRDWDNWTEIMAIAGEPVEAARVTAPRPGHADLAGMLKIGSRDARDVLERASARETAARVAAGALAKALLAELGVAVNSFVCGIGSAAIEGDEVVDGISWSDVEASDVRCPDAEVAARMRQVIDEARAAGESVGGVFCVVVTGLVPGVGSYAQARERLDAELAAAIISIPAIKGVEFGDGFAAAGRVGSLVHDEILHDESQGYHRSTNRAGGVEGGMTNGEPLVVRAAMKPIPTLMKPLSTVDIDTHQVADASTERSDVCAVPAAGVVAEAEVALVIARAYMRKFGADSLVDIQSALASYRSRITL